MKRNWTAATMGVAGYAMFLGGFYYAEWPVSMMGLLMLQLAYWERIAGDMAELRKQIEETN
jgi:hypothetical protein